MNLRKKLRQMPRRLKLKSVKRLIVCLLMLSLVLLLTSCAYSSEQIEFNYVQKGNSSPAEGYWLDVPTGRNLLHMIRTYREQSEYWEAAHGALSEEFKAYIDKTNDIYPDTVQGHWGHSSNFASVDSETGGGSRTYPATLLTLVS